MNQEFEQLYSRIRNFPSPELSLSPTDKLLRKLLKEYGFSKSIIDIYNYWADVLLPKQITSQGIKTPYGVVMYENVKLLKPTYIDYSTGEEKDLTPNIARENNYTYKGKLTATLYLLVNGKKEYIKNRFYTEATIGYIPIMLGSKYCRLHGLSDIDKVALGESPNDPLGYFIIKGSEKVILIQERLRFKIPFLFKDKNDNVVCITKDEKYSQVYLTILSIGKKSQKFKIKIKSTKGKSINIFFLYYLLYNENPESNKSKIIENALNGIVSFSGKESFSVKEARYILNVSENKFIETGDILSYLKTKNIKAENYKEARDIVLYDLFVNVDNVNNKIQQLNFVISIMIRYYLRKRNIDNRDFWGNKILESAGKSIERLFGLIWNSIVLINTPKNKKELITNIYSLIKETAIIEEFEKAFRGNSWGLSNGTIKENITDSLKSETPLAIYSQITKVNTPSGRKGKQTSIRMIQPSQIGFICIIESPEGENLGLVKNLSLLSFISKERSTEDIKSYLKEFEKNNIINQKYNESSIPFFINEEFVGYASSLSEEKDIMGRNKTLLELEIIKLKRSGKLPLDSSVTYNKIDNVIEYFCDGNRPIRPLLIVNSKGKLVIDDKNLWDASIDTLFKEGAIEFVDPREQDYIMLGISPEIVRRTYDENQKIKRTPNYTHSEIDPVEIFGIVGSLEPQPNSGQGPRATYQASMSKQALGYYHYNHALKFDTSFKVMLNPARPMFETIINEPAGLNTTPTGTTPICAFLIMPDNNEDAIVAKKEYLEGINLDIIKYTSYEVILETNEEFTRPNGDHRYDAIDKNGFPILDKRVIPGDCIVGKVVRNTNENVSLFCKIGEGGYIDRVLITTNEENKQIVRVKIRQFRKQISGDKLASRYAQKGTLSRIIPSNELPSIIGGPNDGLVPDFFINPHCIPSRMTMGLMKELLSNKAVIYDNKRVDATCFHPFSIESYINILKSKNMGTTETMIWPDGTKINKIYVGPVYYQLLRHHVLDKIQIRGRGNMLPLTHQPVEGRSNQGGLRVGEMERDALISHGSTSLLLERLMIVSDKYTVIVCDACGTIAINNIKENKFICRQCKETSYSSITIPYIFKLMMQYLSGMSMNVEMKFKNKTKFT